MSNPTELTELGVNLRKALNAYRFYPAGHQKVVEFNEKLLMSVRSVGGVALQVTIAGLFVGEHIVLEGESVHDAPTRPLFLEGVLRINISKEVTLGEIGALLQVWHAALVRLIPTGQSLTTMLWDLGLKHIEIDFAELAGMQDATDAEVEREQKRKSVISSILTQLTGKKGMKRAAPSSAAAARAGIAESTGLDLDALKSDFILPTPLTPEEIAQLNRELRTSKGSHGTRLSTAAWEVFDAAVETERAAVAGWFAQAIGALFQSEGVAAIEALDDLIQRLNVNARQSGSGERLVEWLASLSDPSRVARWAALLSDASTSRAAAQLISHLPRTVVGDLIPVLPAIHLVEARMSLAMQWAGRKVLIRALVRSMSSLQPADAEWVHVLLEAAPDGRAMFGELYAAASSPMRAALLELVPSAFFQPLKAALISSIESGQPGERLAAAKMAAALRLASTESVVVKALLDTVGKPEAIAWMTLLAGFETLPALEGLAAYFKAEKELSLRVACARLFGQLGSPRAVTWLEEASKGFLVNRKLKAACEDAIRAIRSGM